MGEKSDHVNVISLAIKLYLVHALSFDSHPTVYKIEKPFIRIKGLVSMAREVEDTVHTPSLGRGEGALEENGVRPAREPPNLSRPPIAEGLPRTLIPGVGGRAGFFHGRGASDKYPLPSCFSSGKA